MYAIRSYYVNTRRLVMAPIDLKSRLLSLIDREIERSTPECPGRIMAKMNSLADPEIIEALYRASRAGVKVFLNVRGVCMLVPGVRITSYNVCYTKLLRGPPSRRAVSPRSGAAPWGCSRS